MPVVSTVQVTSFVQFDGDQSTAVHTRTVVEISDDGDVLIEDSAEIDNAGSAVCVRQSAQVDTERSQMLLHSETQQDRPEFDPKAPPNDVTVEQCSDLVEDDETKEARTNVTISPHPKRSRSHDGSVPDKTGTDNVNDETTQEDHVRGKTRDESPRKSSTTDDSSLTQVSDLDKGIDERDSVHEQNVKTKDNVRKRTSSTTSYTAECGQKPAIPETSDKTPTTYAVQPKEETSSAQQQGVPQEKRDKTTTEFHVDDVEEIKYDPASGSEFVKKDFDEHEVDVHRVNLTRVLNLLGDIGTKTIGAPKEAEPESRAHPVEIEESEDAVEQVHHPKTEKSPKTPPIPIVASHTQDTTADDRLSPESIRRRSLSQLGARPKLSTLELLTEDMSGVRLSRRRSSLDIGSSSPHRQAPRGAQERASESRRVSFDMQTTDSPSERFESKSRPSKDKRAVPSSIPPPPRDSDGDENRSRSRSPATNRLAVEDIPRKAAVRSLRKQLRPSLGLRAKVRKLSRGLEEELPRPSSRLAKTVRTKSSAPSGTSPTLSRRAHTKGVVHKYATKD